MIELSLEKWADRLLVSKQYSTRSICYDDGVTVVIDNTTGLLYAVTYNIKTKKMEVREIDDNAIT